MKIIIFTVATVLVYVTAAANPCQILQEWQARIYPASSSFKCPDPRNKHLCWGYIWGATDDFLKETQKIKDEHCKEGKTVNFDDMCLRIKEELPYTFDKTLEEMFSKNKASMRTMEQLVHGLRRKVIAWSKEIC